jgi:hypothetical protein
MSKCHLKSGYPLTAHCQGEVSDNFSTKDMVGEDSVCFLFVKVNILNGRLLFQLDGHHRLSAAKAGAPGRGQDDVLYLLLLYYAKQRAHNLSGTGGNAACTHMDSYFGASGTFPQQCLASHLLGNPV